MTCFFPSQHRAKDIHTSLHLHHVSCTVIAKPISVLWPQKYIRRTQTSYTATYNDAVSYGQKLSRFGSLPNSAHKTNRVALRNFKGAYVASTLRTSDLQCHTHAIGYFQMHCEQNVSGPNFLPMANQIWREVQVLPV